LCRFYARSATGSSFQLKVFAKMLSVLFTAIHNWRYQVMTAKMRKERLQEMLAEQPNDPFLRYGLAMEFLSEGSDDEAVRCFNELIAVTPDYVPAYLQAAQALVRLRRTEQARQVFSRGIAAAQKQGDQHAAEEMQAFLADLG
jgi:Tfp pilus assembly protein PilF